MSFQQGFKDVSRDVRDGVRSLAKRPGFTAVAVLSLALGIGANTAIFSLVNAIILRDSPIDRPEEVVNLYLHQASFAFSTFSYPDYEDARDGTTEVFSNIGAAQIVPVQIDQAASPPPSPCFGVPFRRPPTLRWPFSNGGVIAGCHPYYWATTLVPTSCGPSLAGGEHSFAEPEAPGRDLDELVIADELDRLLEVERAG